MSLKDTIRQANHSGGEDHDEDLLSTDEKSIIDFVESPEGLNFQGLYPVQRFILKAFYNVELDDTDEYIRIPKSWRYAQSEDERHFHHFTEQEYLEYLHEQGRCNVKDIDSDRHELILSMGRRAGKSFVSGIIAAYESYKLLRKGNPHKYYGLSEGTEIQIASVATSSDQSKILYKEVKRHFNNCHYFQKYMSRSTKSKVQFQTKKDIQRSGPASQGGDQSITVTFFSSVSKGLRGGSNLCVILDEAAFFARSGESSAEAVYEAVKPSLATFSPKDPDNPQKPLGDSEGRMVMISSPFDRSGLFYEKYQDAKSSNKDTDDVLMIQAPTWEVNPTIANKYFKKEYNSDPKAFAREFGAKFSDQTQTWIDNEEDLQVCIDHDLKPEKQGRPRDPYYLGMDLGVKNHRTAVALTKPVSDDKVELRYHEEWQAGEPWEKLNPHLDDPISSYVYSMPDVETLDFEAIADWVQDLSERFYIDRGIFDQFQGLSFEQSLERRGLTQIEMKNFSVKETSQIFQAFRNLMFHEKLCLYDYVTEDEERENGHAPYINEILELQSESRGKNKIEVKAPSAATKYDDFSDALMRSIWLSYDQISGEAHISHSGGNQNVTLGGRSRRRGASRGQSSPNRNHAPYSSKGGSNPHYGEGDYDERDPSEHQKRRQEISKYFS